MGGILAGAALATWLTPGRSFRVGTVRVLDTLGALAAVGIGVAWFRLDGTKPFLYHGGFWLTELGALALITCATLGDRSLVARALALRPITLVGTVSYGVYLWHWPVNVFLTPERVHLHGFTLHALRFAITFAIAIASYRFFERPIRRHGLPFGRAQYIVPAAVALSVFLVVRATYARDQATPIVIPDPVPDAMPSPESVRYRVAVFGDSTANSLGWGLRGLHVQGLAVDLKGKDGCTMLGDTCGGAHWAEHARELRPDVILVHLGGAFLHGFNAGGHWHTACMADWDRDFQRVLTERLRDLQAGTGRVFAVTSPYPLGEWDTPAYRAQVDCINTSIRHAAQAVPGVRLLDLGAHLCPAGVCQQDLPGQEEPIRPDGVHFSLSGAHELSRWALAQIQE
jgi:hypothetical protein